MRAQSKRPPTVQSLRSHLLCGTPVPSPLTELGRPWAQTLVSAKMIFFSISFVIPSLRNLSQSKTFWRKVWLSRLGLFGKTKQNKTLFCQVPAWLWLSYPNWCSINTTCWTTYRQTITKPRGLLPLPLPQHQQALHCTRTLTSIGQTRQHWHEVAWVKLQIQKSHTKGRVSHGKGTVLNHSCNTKANFMQK